MVGNLEGNFGGLISKPIILLDILNYLMEKIKNIGHINSAIQTNWGNCDNARFYENTPIKTHKYFASKGGLANYSDLKLIEQYLSKAKSILEVGAGYGRVIEYLIKKNSYNIKKIYALERSQKYYKILQKKFSYKIKIFNSDLFDFKVKIKFDLILWLWSGITDFSESEQFLAMSILTKHLKKRGIFILDTFAHNVKPSNTNNSQNQHYATNIGDYMLRGYIPSPRTILKYGEKLGFANTEYLPYCTSTCRPRSLYILSK